MNRWGGESAGYWASISRRANGSIVLKPTYIKGWKHNQLNEMPLSIIDKVSQAVMLVPSSSGVYNLVANGEVPLTLSDQLRRSVLGVDR
ncbi:hypothetical protein D5R40_29490 [Okeania hirsuta]|uniref:Uncharacterized protein n=1 Tax=Okeania hirsuta TaxID=1458930 RepID=A0A3N6RAS9_9CYAN|nr:hypothetical protein D5R40_29490 [Okeania hirsuta]